MVEPPDYHEEMSWKPSLESDLGNVSSFVRGVIKAIIGIDPLELPEQLLAGDWADVRQIADRFNNVAWCYYDSCDDINACQNDSVNDWIGNAGDSMRNYLTQLATGFYGEYQKNGWLASHLASLAEGVFEGMNVLTDVASDWINTKLIPAIAAIGIAGVSEEIPLVNIFTTGAAGINAYEAIQAGMEVYDKANKVKTVIDDFLSVLDVSEYGSVTLPVDAAPMPANADTYTTPIGDGS